VTKDRVVVEEHVLVIENSRNEQLVEVILNDLVIIPSLELPTSVIQEEMKTEVFDSSNIVLVDEELIETLFVDIGIPGPPGTSGSGSAGSVFIQNITSTGIVSDYVWILTNKHLASAKTDSVVVTVTALVEGGSDGYKPEVTVNGTEATVTETTTLRIFQASATISLEVGDNVVSVVSSSGGSDTMTITRLAGGPSVLSVTLSSPVSPQTHYRSGQMVQAVITTDLDAVSVNIAASGACGSSVNAAVVNGSVTVNFPVSSISGNSPITVKAFNSFGTAGDVFISANVPIDQVLPTLSMSVAYLSGHYAVANGETASLNTSAANFTSFSYSFPAGISGTPEFESVKELTCSSANNDTTLTIQATAIKNTNNSSVNGSVSVRVVNVGPSLNITIDNNPVGLIRSPLGTSYTLRIVASQPLISLSVPGITLTPNGARTTWTGTLKIYDNTPTGNLTITASASGAAAHSSEESADFIVGGFSSRNITWPAFSRVAPIGIPVYLDSNVTVVLGNKSLLRQTDATDRPEGFYVADANGSYNPNGSYIALSDVAFAGSNTTGSLQGTVAES
jgi:hypothetical protein